MAHSDRGEEQNQATAAGSAPVYPGMPLWVKIVGIVALLLVVIVVVMLVGVGGHGPRQHMP